MSDFNGNQESVLRKVQKLFALAGNNPNQQEAEAAMLKAQMLLMENGLTQEHVNDYTESDENNTDTVEMRQPAKKQKSLRQWQIMLAKVIAPNFRCKILIGHNQIPRSWKRTTELNVYGMSRDVEACKATMEFSFVAFESLWKKFHKELVERGEAGYSRGITSAIKNDYTIGFCKGLEARFAEQVQSKALSIVIPNAVIETVKRHTAGTHHTTSYNVMNNRGAISRGYSDGKMAQRGRYLA